MPWTLAPSVYLIPHPESGVRGEPYKRILIMRPAHCFSRRNQRPGQENGGGVEFSRDGSQQEYNTIGQCQDTGRDSVTRATMRVEFL